MYVYFIELLNFLQLAIHPAVRSDVYFTGEKFVMDEGNSIIYGLEYQVN